MYFPVQFSVYECPIYQYWGEMDNRAVCSPLRLGFATTIFTYSNNTFRRLSRLCEWYTLVKAARQCGLINDVLTGTVENVNIPTLFTHVIRENVKVVNSLTEVNEFSLLREVLQQCDDDTAASLITEAIKSGTIGDVLKAPVKYKTEESVGGLSVKVLRIASRLKRVVSLRVITDLLIEADQTDVLPKLVRAINDQGLITVTSLLVKAIGCGVLQKVLIDTGACGYLGNVVAAAARVTGQKTKSTSVFASIVRESENIGMLSEVIEVAAERGLLAEVMLEARHVGESTEVSRSTIGRVMSYADVSGKLRKTLMSVLCLNIPRTVVLEAAKDQAILEEVLALIQMFDMLSAVIALILLSLSVLSGRSGKRGQSSGDHLGFVIAKVTLGSGDVERNPGPDINQKQDFYFNTWLKEMFALVIRLEHGYQGNIPWKNLKHIRDPHKLNRSELKALFHHHIQLFHNAESKITQTHIEEFRLLKTFIMNGDEPNMEMLKGLVMKRKAIVDLNMIKPFRNIQTLSDADQQEVVQSLGTQIVKNLSPHLLSLLLETIKEQTTENKVGSTSDDESTGDPSAEEDRENSEYVGQQVQPGNGQAHATADDVRTEDHERGVSDVEHKQTPDYGSVASRIGSDAEHVASSTNSSSMMTCDSPVNENVLTNHTQDTGTAEVQLPAVDNKNASNVITTKQQEDASLPDWLDLPDDILDWIGELEQNVSAGIDDTGSSQKDPVEMLLSVENNVVNTDAAVTKDSSGDCESHVGDTSPQEKQWSAIEQLQKQIQEIKEYVGMNKTDKCSGRPEDTESLCRKRQGSPNLQHEDGPVPKASKSC